MSRIQASATTVLLRGLRVRCPACGVGRLFRRGVESVRACPVCDWRLERCAGHWVGGNEINLLATFSVGVAGFVACVLVTGLGSLAVWLPVAASGVFAVAFYRPSRGIFFALDYLVDPMPDVPGRPSDGDGDGRDGGSREPGDVHGCGARPLLGAVAPCTDVTSESFIPPRATPYPPTRTVSR